MGANASAVPKKKIEETPEETIEELLIRLIEEERSKLRENRVEEEKLDNRLSKINTEIQTLASFTMYPKEINRLASFMYDKITSEEAIESYKEQNPNKIESLESDYNTLKTEKDTIVSNIEKLDKKIDELKKIKLEALSSQNLRNNKPYYPNMRTPYYPNMRTPYTPY